jgi:hypothetical protein
MLIRNDVGTEVINVDQTFSLGIVAAQDGGSYVLVAFSAAQWQAGLTVGSMDRCRSALDAIQAGVKQRAHIVDLLGLLGQRPDIAVPQPKIVLPGNGEGRP